MRAPLAPFLSMQTIPPPIAIGSIGLAIGAIAWSIVSPVEPKNDYRAFYACKELHPAKYCAMRHLPQEGR